MRPLRTPANALALAMAWATALFILTGCEHHGDSPTADRASGQGVDVALASTNNAIQVFAPVRNANEALMSTVAPTDITSTSFHAVAANQPGPLLVTQSDSGDFKADAVGAPGTRVSRDLQGLLLVCASATSAPELALTTPGWVATPLNADDPAVDGATYELHYGCNPSDRDQEQSVSTTDADLAALFQGQAVMDQGVEQYFVYAQALRLTRGAETRYAIISTGTAPNGDRSVQVLVRTAAPVPPAVAAAVPPASGS